VTNAISIKSEIIKHNPKSGHLGAIKIGSHIVAMNATNAISEISMQEPVWHVRKIKAGNNIVIIMKNNMIKQDILSKHIPERILETALDILYP
jgi:hypothetical protein